MDRFALIDAAVSFKPVPRIPVAPLMINFVGACAGISQGALYRSFPAWLAALDATHQRVGPCDMVFPRWVRDVTDMQMLDARIPGRDLPDDAAAQFVERELMQQDDYAYILKNGYRRWFFEHLGQLWKIRQPFPFSLPRILPRLAGTNRRAAVIRRRWASRGVPVSFDSAFYPPFDLFSLVRSMEPFAYDLHDCPEKVEAACQKSLPDALSQAKMLLKVSGGKRLAIYPMRSSASFLSPRTFERFAWPALKHSVESLWKDGIVSVLHCDGNWTPMLRFLKNLPALSCIIELDEQTDMIQARQVLGDRLCLKGNVPAAMLAFGTPDEVRAYCDKLICSVGPRGFILSSGCEVPTNARLENVQAMLAAVHAPLQ